MYQKEVLLAQDSTEITKPLDADFRIGDFRLFIDLDRSNLLISIIKIGDRKNIYKN